MIEKQQQKLHPLHSAEMLAAQVQHTGRYPDLDRCTGRSTIKAMEYITLAMRAPHVWVRVRDHWDTEFAHRSMVGRCADMVQKLGLQHFKFDPIRCLIIFGTPL